VHALLCGNTCAEQCDHANRAFIHSFIHAHRACTQQHQASTLGSLEALLEFLSTIPIPVASFAIGPVSKRDVLCASVMLEHKTEYATILAFDVKVNADAKMKATVDGVKIFTADIIYHLFDQFTECVASVNGFCRGD
jgi:translation initiation factor IF-2